MEYKELNIKGVVLDKGQLENYLEKLASDNTLQEKSSKDTYPIPTLKKNFEAITGVYHLLNEHIKLGIPIHPAGEWILDNFYIVEEVVKSIMKELTLKKYTSFLGISNGMYKGYARIYVLASEIIAHTDSKVVGQDIKEYLRSYQKKKSLSMEEIWNIGLFMQISIIQNIKDICEKIYLNQMQKYRVENIIERLVDETEEPKFKNLSEYKAKVKGYGEMKYPFIEYLSYRLKRYGKTAYSFQNALEEQVNKMGTSIEEVIKKEHFDVALKKVSMGNSIIGIKTLQRIDFLEIFESINSVEELLKQDPAEVYTKMDYKTKEYYRNEIKKIAKKTKISEMYIAKKVLELAQTAKQKEIIEEKRTHIGYYLIDKGKWELQNALQTKIGIKIEEKTKVKLYISTIAISTVLIDLLLTYFIYYQIKNIFLSILLWIILLLPIQEIVVQVLQAILSKIVKPKMIPKIDRQEGVPEEETTFVVIPTIIKSREKVKDLMKKLEIYYLANKSENLYFVLLGDCSSRKK